MPRVENLGPSVAKWHEGTREGSSAHDVCQRCYKRLERDPHCLDDRLKPYNRGEPQGEDGWGGDVAHPPYDDFAHSYSPLYCIGCRAKLSGDDDNAT